MEINQTSKIDDLTQALYGTWELSVDNDWKCIEQGHLRIFKKICQKGSNVLPNKFLKERTEVCPVIEFYKDKIGGQVLTLQQDAITVADNCLVVIIQF